MFQRILILCLFTLSPVFTSQAASVHRACSPLQAYLHRSLYGQLMIQPIFELPKLHLNGNTVTSSFDYFLGECRTDGKYHRFDYFDISPDEDIVRLRLFDEKGEVFSQSSPHHSGRKLHTWDRSSFLALFDEELKQRGSFDLQLIAYIGTDERTFNWSGVAATTYKVTLHGHESFSLEKISSGHRSGQRR